MGRYACELFILLNICGLLLANMPFCLQPEVPENGHAIFPSSEPVLTGTRVQYECDVGFTRLGTSSRVCLNSGKWSDAMPFCVINVALHRPTVQSTLQQPANVPVSDAKLATDGNLQSCNSQPATWLEIDLLQVQSVLAIEVQIARSSQSQDGELVYLEVAVGANGYQEKNAAQNAIICRTHRGTLKGGVVQTFMCERELVGRFVTVKIVTDSLMGVSICEIVVLSQRAASYWQCSAVPNYDRWGVYNGHCYLGSQEAQPWFTASSNCQLAGASLLNEITFLEQRFLQTQLNARAPTGNDLYWIGAQNDQLGNWRWQTGTIVVTGFWASGNGTVGTAGSYSAAMARPENWFWAPYLQSAWNRWVCRAGLVFCASPGVPYNGGVLLSSTNYALGTTAYYYCGYGHVIFGNDKRTCLTNGTWSGKIPDCVAVNCGTPEVLAGGEYELLNRSSLFESIVQYRCHPGYILKGSMIRKCQADGLWSDKLATCVTVDCGAPDPVENANITLLANHTKVGALVEISCNQGYRLVGSSLRHCLASGSWSPDAGICHDIASLKRALVGGEEVSSTNGDESGKSTSNNLIAGFMATIAVLALILAVAGVCIWKRRKQLHSFSNFSGSGSSTAQARNDILYAFTNACINNNHSTESCSYATLPFTIRQYNNHYGTHGLVKGASNAVTSDDSSTSTCASDYYSKSELARCSCSCSAALCDNTLPKGDPLYQQTNSVILATNGAAYLVSPIISATPAASSNDVASHYQVLENLLKQQTLPKSSKSAASTLPRGMFKSKPQKLEDNRLDPGSRTVRVKPPLQADPAALLANIFQQSQNTQTSDRPVSTISSLYKRPNKPPRKTKLPPPTPAKPPEMLVAANRADSPSSDLFGFDDDDDDYDEWDEAGESANENESTVVSPSNMNSKRDVIYEVPPDAKQGLNSDDNIYETLPKLWSKHGSTVVI